MMVEPVTRVTSRRNRYCEAYVEVGHEHVGGCGKEPDHDGPHEVLWGVWPPCRGCGGLDEHSEDCPTPDETRSGHFPYTLVRWRDGGKPWIGMERKQVPVPRSGDEEDVTPDR